MKQSGVRIAAGWLLMLGLSLGLPLAQPTQTAPAKGMVEVTYYFLPG